MRKGFKHFGDLTYTTAQPIRRSGALRLLLLLFSPTRTRPSLFLFASPRSHASQTRSGHTPLRTCTTTGSASEAFDQDERGKTVLPRTATVEIYKKRQELHSYFVQSYLRMLPLNSPIAQPFPIWHHQANPKPRHSFPWIDPLGSLTDFCSCISRWTSTLAPILVPSCLVLAPLRFLSLRSRTR